MDGAMSRPGLLVSLLLVVGLAGCGARVAPGTMTSAESAQARASSPLPGATSDAGGDGAETDAEAAAAQHAGTERDAAAADASLGADGEPASDVQMAPQGGDLKMAAEPRCTRPGGVVSVTVTGPPNALLVMIVGYADGQSHGSKLITTTDPTGRFVWKLVVPPTVPEGRAAVMGQTSGANQQGHGPNGWVTFTVAGAEGC